MGSLTLNLGIEFRIVFANVRSVWLHYRYVININSLTPNGHYTDRTAPLTSRRCILNIYSKNISTEYFKRAT
jgi:hypothetical protein